MKIKIASVETRKSDKAGSFTYAKGSILKKDGTVRENVTFLAFGAQRDAVKGKLRKDRTVDVKAVFDGGTVKILGLAEAKAA